MNSNEEWLQRPGGLASRLRELRTGTDLTGSQLAEALCWIQPKVSKIENGKQFPSAADVEAWVRACGGTDDTVAAMLDLRGESETQHRKWRQQVRGGQVAIQQDYDDMVRQATVIRNAEVTTVPGLLQTPDYARQQALQGVPLHGADPDEIDATMAARIRRQDVLYDPSKRFEFVITEACLRLLYVPAEAMLAQMDRLLGLTFGRDNLQFGIIPFGRVLPAVPWNGFLILDDLAIVEHFAGELRVRDVQAATYAKAMDLLMGEAVTGEQARALIVRAMEDIRAA